MSRGQSLNSFPVWQPSFILYNATLNKWLARLSQQRKRDSMVYFFLLLLLTWSFIFIFFYWSIVTLQYCVNLHCTAKWISYTYTYIPSFLEFLLIEVTTEHWVEFLVLYSRFSLVIYFIHSINSVYMSIPISQFIPPSPPFPLASIRLFSTSVSLFLLHK